MSVENIKLTADGAYPAALGRRATFANGRMPRICFVGPKNLPMLAPEFSAVSAGGAELQDTLVAKALARRGYEVSMVVADYGQKDGATWDGVKTFKTCRLDAGVPGLRALYPRLTHLWAAMRRADADIYYTSCAGRQIFEMAAFTRALGRKAIFRVASDADCDPSKLLIGREIDKKLYTRGLHLADAVLAQSVAQQQALRVNFGRDSEVALSLTDLSGAIRSFQHRDISVLWVGNIRQLKRPDLLLELARRLPEFSFHMIGGKMPKAEALFESLQSEAAAIPNLTFHGHMPYHQVNGYFERARVYVCTSNTEGFPNTFLQAWTRGTPVATLLDPEGVVAANGLGTSVDSMDDLLDAVRTLVTDAGRWNESSQRCRAYIDAQCNEDEILAPYVQTFSDLLVKESAAR